MLHSQCDPKNINKTGSSPSRRLGNRILKPTLGRNTQAVRKSARDEEGNKKNRFPIQYWPAKCRFPKILPSGLYNTFNGNMERLFFEENERIAAFSTQQQTCGHFCC